MPKAQPSNQELLSAIRSLRKMARESNAPIWRDVADNLQVSKRRRIAVNLSRLNRHTKTKETVIVPGKVLGSGTLTHPVSVAAFSFSTQAKAKILKAKGKCLSISDLLETNPKGSNVRIIG
jgi:large subunit ribosomal protein L18e